MIKIENLRNGLIDFWHKMPFEHCVIDNFFDLETALALEKEFLDFESNKWHYYHNPIEEKKALNDWNVFPALTYKIFNALNSPEIIELFSKAVGMPLFSDQGLHGGGWHIHGVSGNLNPHLDYSIHPKLGLERKLNIIIYLSSSLNPDMHGGHLGLWEHDKLKNAPGTLKKEVAPLFNRAVLFDTTQMSWHGMSRPLQVPAGIYRKSLAVYYLCKPSPTADPRQRALFAARDNQKDDPLIKGIIELRSHTNTSDKVYRVDMPHK